MQRTEFDTLIVCDNFLDQELLNDLTALVQGAETIALNDNDCNHVMEEATAYDWYMLRTELRRSELRYPLLQRIGQVIGLELPTENLNPLQLFAKKFEPTRSFCAPHIEDHRIYGDWTYMLYLTDETDGALRTDGISILPKRNRLVCMHVDILHEVDNCSGDRLNISGWPFANEEPFLRWKGQTTSQ
jgi:hypothetical protein